MTTWFLLSLQCMSVFCDNSWCGKSAVYLSQACWLSCMQKRSAVVTLYCVSLSNIYSSQNSIMHRHRPVQMNVDNPTSMYDRSIDRRLLQNVEGLKGLQKRQ